MKSLDWWQLSFMEFGSIAHCRPKS